VSETISTNFNFFSVISELSNNKWRGPKTPIIKRASKEKQFNINKESWNGAKKVAPVVRKENLALLPLSESQFGSECLFYGHGVISGGSLSGRQVLPLDPAHFATRHLFLLFTILLRALFGSGPEQTERESRCAGGGRIHSQIEQLVCKRERERDLIYRLSSRFSA